jgi:ketosteroid isomerase-like protein
MEEARGDAGLTEADLEAVHSMVDAFNQRDADAAWGLTNGEMEFRSTLVDLQGDSGVYSGREDIDRYFTDLDEVIEDWQIREHLCVESGDGCVVLLYRIAGRGRGSGVPMEHEYGIVWRLDDGKLVTGDTYADPGAALAAAGLPEHFGENLQLTRDYAKAVGEGDVEKLGRSLHQDAVWEHNLGSGSVEEGVYKGKEAIVELFSRIVEVWETLLPKPRDVFPVGRGGLRVLGALHSKHRLTATELVTPYEQRLEMRDGLLYRARMSIGEGIHIESHEGTHAE